MTPRKSIAIHFTGKLVSRFQTHLQSCGTPQDKPSGEMLTLEYKYGNTHELWLGTMSNSGTIGIFKWLTFLELRKLNYR